MLGKKKIGQQPIMRVPEFEYNPTGPNNPSKQVDKNTNFSLRPITLENIDEAFFRTFNRTLKVGKKDIELQRKNRRRKRKKQLSITKRTKRIIA